MSCVVDDDDDLLLPVEGNAYADYALNRNWFASIQGRPRGITFMIRAKNEEQTIAQCVESIYRELLPRSVPFDIVLIDNGSTDETTTKAAEGAAADPSLIRIVFYPLQIAKAGLETYVTSCNSAHSFPWFTQFSLMQCTTYSHVFRWDADFVMTAPLAERLRADFVLPPLSSSSVPHEAYSIPALHEADEVGYEVYLIAVAAGLHYMRSFLWEHWTTVRKLTPLQLPKHECVVHCSKLANVKPYLQSVPWWDSEAVLQSVRTLASTQSAKAAFEDWRAKLADDTQLYCRSCDPNCNKLICSLPRTNDKIQGLLPYTLTAPLIFQIGLHKTATVNIYYACEYLGIKAMHVEPENVHNVFENHLEQGKPFGDIVAFADFLWIDSDDEMSNAKERVRRLKTMYPCAKFILNYRDVDEWLLSHYRHQYDAAKEAQNVSKLQRAKARWFAWYAFVLDLFLANNGVDANRLLSFNINRDDPLKFANFVRPSDANIGVFFWRQHHRTPASKKAILLPGPPLWWSNENMESLRARAAANFDAIFGHAFVINLAKRTDRLEQFRASLRNVGLPEQRVERFDAVAVKGRGWLGCVRSHVAILRIAIERGYDRIVVFEDDFVFCEDSRPVLPKLEMLIDGSDYDVFMLGARVVESESVSDTGVMRVKRAFTSSAYVVQRHYFETLLGNLEESERLLDAHVFTLKENYQKGYALDMHWQTLQQRDRWLAHQPVLGKQASGYSDIEERHSVHDYR